MRFMFTNRLFTSVWSELFKNQVCRLKFLFDITNNYRASATPTGHCDNCSNRHVTSDAVRWCPDCEEALCETCLQHHNASKLLKSHETVAIVDNTKLPDFISGLRTYCPEHDEKFELYCMRHQECCCHSCVIEKHHECTVYDTIKNVVKDVKTSSAFEEVEHALEDVIKNFDAIIENRTACKASVLNQSNAKSAEIRQVRERANQHLDQIEQALVQQLSEEVDGINSGVDEVVRKVTERKASAEKLKKQLENITEFATDIQTFLGIKVLEGRVGDDLKFQRSILDESSEIVFEVEFSDVMKSFTEMVAKFGNFKAKKLPPMVELVVRKKEQAQILMPVSKSVHHVHSVRLRKKLTVSLPVGNERIGIQGCTFLPCGAMAFCDYNTKVIIVCDGNGKHLNTLSTKGKPFDITFIENNKIAVTLADDCKVGIFNLRTGCEVSSFKTSTECLGIEFQNDRFFIRLAGKFIETDLKGNVLRTIPCDSCRYYFCLFMDSILSTNLDNDSVLCLDISGRPKWTANNPILKGPLFITTDTDGLLFVSGKKSNNVVVVSHDGGEFKEILSGSDLSNPTGIYFDKKSKKLLVGELLTGKAYVYDVSFG